MASVLLTGASGFIAAHVLKILIDRGYTVKATVRSQAKADYIKNQYPDAKLSFSIVPDIAASGAFDEAVKGVDYIVHTASPFHFKVTDPVKDMLDPAVKGTRSVLEAAKAYAPQVKRIVITSSFAAIVNITKGDWPGHVYTEEDWNEVTWEEAAGKDASTTYRGSKTFAEKAAWDFVRDEKPNFEVTTINPPLVWGPMLHDVSPETINTSNAMVYGMINGSVKTTSTMHAGWVDVRNVAEAHVKAFETPEAAGQRYFLIGGKFYYPDVVKIIQKNFPELADKLPTISDEPLPPFWDFSNEKSRKQLGIEYLTLEQSIVDLTKQLISWVPK
ncbi:hypothetical protein V1512DRAFT_235199 [Lipomyces arxii]|uniref:uncharacterized protein n=1 Tax=Lipomyces arxii TaxID=56418 RepID=UPI0034CD8C50